MADTTNASSTTSEGLADLVALYRQLGAVSAAVFAPLAQTYVGTLVEQDEATNAEVVKLALRKLAYEAGEMLVANNPPTDKPITPFVLDKAGNPPDLSLAYVAAAALAYLKDRDAKAENAAAGAATTARTVVEVLPAAATSVRALRASARTASYAAMPVGTVPVTTRTTGGCGCSGGGASATSSRQPTSAIASARSSSTGTSRCGCGGGCGSGSTTTATQPVPCYDPCAGGLVASPPSETCSCASCQPARSSPTTCPPVLSISCATRQRLRDCVKTLVCDALAILEGRLCKTDAPTPTQAVCTFLECVRGAICPPPEQPCLPPSPMTCLPCDYAVENS